MIPTKPNLRRLTLCILSIFVFSTFKLAAQGDAAAGKKTFTTVCAGCHAVAAEVTGPALAGVESRWADREKLIEWIINAPKLIASGYPKALEVQKLKPTEMTPNPSLTPNDVNNVLAFISAETARLEQAKTKKSDDVEEPQDGQGAVIFGIISIILAIIALILMQVNSNLKKLSDDKEGISRPEPVAFYKNKSYIALGAVVLFVVGGYFVAKGAIGLGRQKDMQPEQPIYYSHKVHAGLNQINCLYCHGGAMEGKQASIPSVNVCMNCHKQISEYKGPAITDANGKVINGTAEIQKLYEYAGVDPKNPQAFDPSKAKSIPWIRIHNLPDHAYFNHAQHVNAGKQQCQTCHGEITAMHEVKQASELSMGWCVNCHRQTNVAFNYDSTSGNKFYSIYEKFHNDLKAGKMDSVKVEHIGGLECQKCHY